ncbi:glutathione-disulfide reductase [Rhizobium sp.]|uniref:glutathione-disulfide reductase n=1 Tax=Rhizobium sp. TaxID=391 RepID=UPI00389A94D7
MTDFDYDLFVIGGGSGGVRAARVAAQHGARVCLAEEYRIGGTCVIRGCVPKKLLVYASRFAEEFEDAIAYGWTTERVTFDWPTLIANKDIEIERLSKAYVRTLESGGIEIIRLRAVLESANVVRLADGQKISAETILLATGARPLVPQHLPGRELVITSNEAFHLESLPRRIAIVGGGYIAVEFAGIFSGLGVETILIYRGEQILRGFDSDLRSGLAAEMTKKGVEILTHADVERMQKSGDGIRLTLTDGRIVGAGAVMYAVGRIPNTLDMNLSKIGVELTPHAAVKVDADSRSSIPSIYAIGDVTNRRNLTPVAIREGHAFADTLYGKRKTAVDYDNIPSAVFSQPELGSVGLSEDDARSRFGKIEIFKTNFRPMKHTLSGRDERTMMKLVVDGLTRKVVGAHILGEGASEMTQLLAVLLRMGATKEDFDNTVALHPTAAEELVTLKG